VATSDEIHIADAAHSLFMEDLKQAYGCHLAAESAFWSELRLAPDRAELPLEQKMQRTAILDIAVKLAVGNRNILLDKFCVAWCRKRGLKV
jgi:hypothetical protein